jgi:hypothetical protein
MTKITGSGPALVEELGIELVNRPNILGSNPEVHLTRATADMLSAVQCHAKGMQEDYLATLLAL